MTAIEYQFAAHFNARPAKHQKNKNVIGVTLETFEVADLAYAPELVISAEYTRQGPIEIHADDDRLFVYAAQFRKNPLSSWNSIIPAVRDHHAKVLREIDEAHTPRPDDI
jgi:hypothetical protein